MRKVIAITGAVISICVLVYLVNGIIRKTNSLKDSETQINTLPSFSFPDLNLKPFYSDSIIEGPVLIVKFHPECEHCQYELTEIFNSPIPKTGIKVLLITNAEIGKTTDYISTFELAGRNNIITLIDTAAVFGEIFGRDIVPSNFIYDRDLKLVAALFGEYKVESIMKYLGLNE